MWLLSFYPHGIYKVNRCIIGCGLVFRDVTDIANMNMSNVIK